MNSEEGDGVHGTVDRKKRKEERPGRAPAAHPEAFREARFCPHCGEGIPMGRKDCQYCGSSGLRTSVAYRSGD